MGVYLLQKPPSTIFQIDYMNYLIRFRNRKEAKLAFFLISGPIFQNCCLKRFFFGIKQKTDFVPTGLFVFAIVFWVLFEANHRKKISKIRQLCSYVLSSAAIAKELITHTRLHRWSSLLELSGETFR